MITDKQFKKLKVGDWFFAVTQKDNSPFEKPRIIKFFVKQIDNDYPYPIVSIKQDRWGRYYRFKESQIHLTYEDALVEKKQILEKIKKFEQEQEERNKIYFAEQEAREKQRQEEHDNKIREEERKKVVQEIREKLKADISIAEDYFAVVKILVQIERGEDV